MRVSVYSTIMFFAFIGCQTVPDVATPPTQNLLVVSSAATIDKETGKQWYDALSLDIEGQGWTGEDLKTPYDRLPAKAEGVVRAPVWNLASHSAGLHLRFITDSRNIHARWSLRGSNLGMHHMPPTGVSGLDLYTRDDNGEWRWVGFGSPKGQKDNEVTLVGSLPAGTREFLVSLPLYNGTASLSIGIDKDALISVAPHAPEDAVVIYGTSITQGGCASRTGMAYTSILRRSLDREVINLGFSGNGRLEPEVAELLAELNPAVYVLDAFPNNGPDQIRERFVPFVHTLRAAHPETPIVIVENIAYQRAWAFEPKGGHFAKNEAVREGYASLVNEGVKGLYYVPFDDLLGDDSLGTVDGTHPTDVGMMRIAEAIEPAIRKALSK